FPKIRSAGTFTREASELNANFDERSRAARYQLSIAVSAPFLAQDSLYCSRSRSEKIPGGEVFRSTRTSSAQSRLRRMNSGSQGSWKNGIYQLLRSCAGFMTRFFMNTRRWGTPKIAVRLTLSEYRAAKYQVTAAPQSCPTTNAFHSATVSNTATISLASTSME